MNMRNFILLILIFGSQSYFYAQKFPISYKIKRSYQECSKCEVKTRSDWSLVNPESYSAKIRDAVEYKIFAEKSYPEKVGWYLGDPDYDKECEMTRSGKHVWKDKFSYLSDKMSKDYFIQHQKKESDKNEKLLKEEEASRIAAEKAKKEREDSKLQFEKLYDILERNRKKASLLLENKEIDRYLVLSELNCITWKGIDSLYREYNLAWNYNNIMPNVKINYNDYYSDVNSFAWYSLLSKNYDKAYKALNVLIKNSEDFENFLKGNEISFLLAGNISHAAYLANNNKTFLWYSHRTASRLNDGEKRKKWCQMMIDDYNKFEELGILQNVDTLKFIVKAWTKQLSIVVSPSASSSTKNAFERNTNLPGFIERINEYFVIKNETQGNYEVKTIDKNLYKFDYPQYISSSSGGYYTKYISFYFYLNKNGDLFIVNKSNADPSDKKLAKIIAKSKEIRDIDLGIISPK
jgi:hypothetical protein